MVCVKGDTGDRTAPRYARLLTGSSGALGVAGARDGKSMPGGFE